MTNVDRTQVEAAVAHYTDPYFQQSLFEMGAVQALDIDGANVHLKIAMPYACSGLHGAIRQIIGLQLEDVDDVEGVQIDIEHDVQAHKASAEPKSLHNVKNIIAVASGKGGVGKSTCSVNLALALAAEGAKVGILDADIYGPSVGMMLGLPDDTRPETHENKAFIPVNVHGIQAMSMAFLVTENTPMVWRGPMASGALLQLLTQTMWDDLDYLVVDMPPGTGDIQLTLSQKVPVSGAVVVTTPQDIALLDCKKGIEMFRKVNIQVLGVIENMSVHICSNCGHHESLFGEGGGQRIAQAYDTVLLGEMPLHQTIREHMDEGQPTVISEPDSEVALLYRDIARKLGAELALHSASGNGPEILVTSD